MGGGGSPRRRGEPAPDLAIPRFPHYRVPPGLQEGLPSLAAVRFRDGSPGRHRVISPGIPNSAMSLAALRELQGLDAAHHLHPFTDHRAMHAAGTNVMVSGEGCWVTDAAGRYRFHTVKPGAYPWGNHYNGWRPNHIHFSLFGPSLVTRLVTQMYFPGDPLLDIDPIYQSSPAGARESMVAKFSIDVTEPSFALGYVFDIVLRGRNATPMER